MGNLDPTGEMILPKNPKDLPEGWNPDASHKDPNGTRYRYKNTDRYLDYHKSHNKDKYGDHWHDSLDEEEGNCPKKKKKKRDHLAPGTEVPDPVEPINPKLQEILDNPPNNFILPMPIPIMPGVPLFI